MVVTSWDFNERMKPLMNSLCGLWTTPWMTDVPDVFVFCTSHLSPWSIRPSTECCERRNLKQCCRWRVTYLTGSWGGGAFLSCSTLFLMEKGSRRRRRAAPLCCACSRLRSKLKDDGLTPEQTALRRLLLACSTPARRHAERKICQSFQALWRAFVWSVRFKPSARRSLVSLGDGTEMESWKCWKRLNWERMRWGI